MFKGQTETTIDEAFTVMYLLISKMFEDENVDIDTMEIEHAIPPLTLRCDMPANFLPSILKSNFPGQ
jgi:hypothetical protein